MRGLMSRAGFCGTNHRGHLDLSLAFQTPQFLLGEGRDGVRKAQSKTRIHQRCPVILLASLWKDMSLGINYQDGPRGNAKSPGYSC